MSDRNHPPGVDSPGPRRVPPPDRRAGPSGGKSPIDVFQSTVQGYTGALEDLTFAMHGLGELVKLAHGDVSERLDRIERHLGIESADE